MRRGLALLALGWLLASLAPAAAEDEPYKGVSVFAMPVQMHIGDTATWVVAKQGAWVPERGKIELYVIGLLNEVEVSPLDPSVHCEVARAATTTYVSCDSTQTPDLITVTGRLAASRRDLKSIGIGIDQADTYLAVDYQFVTGDGVIRDQYLPLVIYGGQP